MVAGVPVPTVMVKLPAGNAEELWANTPEVHEAVVARLLTTTTWVPSALPAAAEAETMLELEEETVLAESDPARLPRSCMSLSRAEV